MSVRTYDFFDGYGYQLFIGDVEMVGKDDSILNRDIFFVIVYI